MWHCTAVANEPHKGRDGGIPSSCPRFATTTTWQASSWISKLGHFNGIPSSLSQCGGRLFSSQKDLVYHYHRETAWHPPPYWAWFRVWCPLPPFWPPISHPPFWSQTEACLPWTPHFCRYTWRVGTDPYWSGTAGLHNASSIDPARHGNIKVSFNQWSSQNY